ALPALPFLTHFLSVVINPTKHKNRHPRLPAWSMAEWMFWRLERRRANLCVQKTPHSCTQKCFLRDEEWPRGQDACPTHSRPSLVASKRSNLN
ncbi:mCG146090, partial [Mus musculus]